MAACLSFFSRPLLFHVPRELSKDSNARRISWGFNLLFFVVAISFSLGYGIVSFVDCSQNLVSVGYYVSDAASCQCKNNPSGSATIGNLILANTTWASQFDSIQSSGYIVKFPCLNNLTCQIVSPYVPFFMDQLYGIQFTNTVTNQTLNQFEFYSGVFDLVTATPLLYTQKSCIITTTYNSTYQTIFEGYNSVDCLNHVHNNIDANYNDQIDINYENNPAYRQYCDLQSCLIRQCTSISAIEIVIFITGIISFSFLTLQAIIKLIFYVRIAYIERVDTIQLAVKSYSSV
jgi:hypothetical protein